MSQSHLPERHSTLAQSFILASILTVSAMTFTAGAKAAPPEPSLPLTATSSADAAASAADPLPMPAAASSPDSGNPVVQQVRDAASDLVMKAMNFLGVRYRRGGNSAEQGFDCSGFTRYVFEHSVGLALPRRAKDQAQGAGLLSVARSELKPGDLVFFNTMRRAFSHVGIYIGEGQFIHAPKPGGEVRIEDLRSAYWARRFDGARRAATDSAQAVAASLAASAGDRQGSGDLTAASVNFAASLKATVSAGLSANAGPTSLVDGGAPNR
jgi:cell wall-associated NlpC family hydrolase